MFQKILIANRGEIAVRILRSARRLSVRTVAVFSDVDRLAPHVELADEAVHIGPSPAPQSYLDIDKILDAARLTGAQAIHPGYGFLSENADFAAACESAGICFIGPSADVIRTMGSKRDAKSLMSQHGVPVVPGFFGDVSDEELGREAEKIGFPVLIKASAGGGGRGMRLVSDSSEFAANLLSARREAKAAFADDSMLLEKYIERPRHIEVQIFGDSHGNVVHLFERDCSVQRRYQKLIEEAPAVGLTVDQRAHIHNAAVLAGKVAGYVGAGTVEFVLDESGDIYFIEMNTRLQVEHPVTEMITGQDLVEWQLKIASGDSLPSQTDIVASGHAIELRLCAEDPARDFAPSTGTINHFSVPDDDVRVDHGIAAGLAISPYYDSMIAKLIVHGEDRTAALIKAVRALEQTEIAGVTTNGRLLRDILRHRDFVSGAVNTHFIDSHQSDLTGAAPTPDDTVFAVAALYSIGNRRQNRISDDQSDTPWHITNSFRLNLNHREVIQFVVENNQHSIVIEHLRQGYMLDLPCGVQRCSIESLVGPNIVIQLGSLRIRGSVAPNDTGMSVFVGGNQYTMLSIDPLDVADTDDAAGGGLAAPMPGTVLEVFVSAGQEVVAGTPVMLIEAMKIEHTITAPFDGTVTEVRFKAGDQITAEGVELAVMEPAA